MGQQNYPLVAFNRGLVSKLGAARADIKRVALSAKTMNNWIARLLGSMCIRPGLWYRGHTKGNAASRFIPFVF
jgi:hypothetical protein